GLEREQRRQGAAHHALVLGEEYADQAGPPTLDTSAPALPPVLVPPTPLSPSPAPAATASPAPGPPPASTGTVATSRNPPLERGPASRLPPTARNRSPRPTRPAPVPSPSVPGDSARPCADGAGPSSSTSSRASALVTDSRMSQLRACECRITFVVASRTAQPS